MAAWVDTGFLVALFTRNDTFHTQATGFLRDNPELELHSIWPVIVESCFFLDNQAQQSLLTWIERGAMRMHEISLIELPLIRQVLQNYSNLKPDFTDAALVALADALGIKNILTVDTRDFSVYRLADGSYIQRLWI